MNRIKDIESALSLFLEAAAMQAEATESGDYKRANKMYDRIIKSVNYLTEHNALGMIEQCLYNENIGIKLWSASFLLSSSIAKNILEEIANGDYGIHFLTAKMILKQSN